jgi:hypothetical protein
VPLDDEDPGLARAGDLDEGIRQPLLVGVEHLLGLVPALHHERAVALDAVAAREPRRAVGILHPVGELASGGLGVLLEQVLGRALAGRVGAEKADGLDRRGQLLEQLDRLGREAVTLVLGQVPARVVAERHGVGEHGHAQRHQHQQGRARAVAHAATAEERGALAPVERGRPDEENGGGDHERPLKPRQPRRKEREAGRAQQAEHGAPDPPALEERHEQRHGGRPNPATASTRGSGARGTARRR